LGGCDKPFDRTPVGFKEACYGDDPPRNWVCSERRWVASFSAKESDWPAIKAMVSTVGTDNSLKVFDVSSNHPGYIRTAELYACSASGVMLSFDKRIYDKAELNGEGDEVRIELRTYKNSYDWRPLADGMESELRAKWPNAVETERPAPLGNARALPDSIRTCDERGS
jgi:hypothetical protein